MTVSDAHVFPSFLIPLLTQISFQSHQLFFSHASAEVRGENTPERNFNRISNSQPPGHESDALSHLGGANLISNAKLCQILQTDSPFTAQSYQPISMVYSHTCGFCHIHCPHSSVTLQRMIGLCVRNTLGKDGLHLNAA